MPYLSGLFDWGACKVSKLGAMSKRKSCKIDRIEWEMHATCVCQVLGFPFVSAWSVCTCTRCPFIAQKSSDTYGGFRAMNGQWVRVHTHKRNACYVKFSAFLLWVCTRTHDSFIAPKSSVSIGGYLRRISVQWMGRWVRVHTLHALTKGKPKTWHTHVACISHSIRSILQVFLLTLSPIY